MSPTPNDPTLHSWLSIPSGSDFPLQNLPFGMFTVGELGPRAATALGDYVIDLAELQEQGFFSELKLPRGIFEQENLNAFIALGQPTWRAVRQRLSDLFNAAKTTGLRANQDAVEAVLHPRDQVKMLLPVRIPDYTDFYSSKEHATNVGTMFRDPTNALLPNWKHLPVAYHGRASSIVVSGTPIHRPKGQLKPNDAPPTFGNSRLMDFELEMGAVIGKKTDMGISVSTAEAEDHIFGLLLFNDWSARDIQKWEYVPLGPFLGKNFASSVSPWIVSLDALEGHRVAGPVQDPPVLPYLEFEGERNIDIQLEVEIVLPDGQSKVVCQSNTKYLYWNLAQQLAHHTCNGCNLNVGDLLASGTISGPEPSSYGSMLELSWRGTKQLQMPDGSERKFLLDGDTVVMRAFAEKNGLRIGFGEVRTEILPNRS